VVAHPGHRQVGQDVLGLSVSLSNWIAAARRGDEGVVRLAHALGLAGGARGVQHDATSSAAPLAISPSRKSGWLRSWIRPISISSSRPMEQGWV
jgi:hypothetical protein